MKREKLNLNGIVAAQPAETDLPPELEACLEALLPDHDARAVYAAMREALDEVHRAQRGAIH